MYYRVCVMCVTELDTAHPSRSISRMRESCTLSDLNGDVDLYRWSEFRNTVDLASALPEVQ